MYENEIKKHKINFKKFAIAVKYKENRAVMQNLLASENTLCFKENEFLDSNFSVDKFVAKCKDFVPMHTLREDLETHYKNIQLALIELINKDYADFVSLSSNLIGTDKTIDNLSNPLGQFKEEIESVKGDLSHVLNDVEKKLEQRKLIREKKTCLHHLINVVHSVEKIEKILTADPKSPDMEFFMNDDKSHPGHFLERIAGEFNQLQFHVNQSKGHPVIESIRPRVALITSKLQENLETTFEQGILKKESEIILRSLRTYALIDKTSHAEEMFRHIVVKPFMDTVVTEEYLNSHSLETICSEILEFVGEECKIMVMLTSADLLTKSADGTSAHAPQEHKQHAVKGFDFLVNSVWVEIAQAFEENLPLIFSPGNPDSFLKRYKIMMKFMDDFEDHCISPECFQALRKHPTYNSFMVKWSLPVYFQIRFQEIGGKIEMATETPSAKSPEELFMTNIVGSCWQGLKTCWSDDVYLSPLKGRFWKLSLQIMNRLVTYIETVAGSQDTKSDESLKLENLSLLLGDASYIPKKLIEYHKDVIMSRLTDCGTRINGRSCSDSINDCCTSLDSCTKLLSDHIVSRLGKEGILQLENVNNVPRLYRRTNKECPTTPSAYIAASFASLHTFKSTSTTLDSIRQNDVIRGAINDMVNKYFSSVDELLTSIKKTEDSLLRLKQQRKAAAGQSSQMPTSKTNEMSDENKIRNQILLDAEEFGRQMEQVGITSQIPEYLKLKEVTTKALQPSEQQSE